MTTNAKLLMAARAVTELGNWCSSIVLPGMLYSLTGDPAATAILIACRFMPTLISAPIIKVIQDGGASSTSIMKSMDIFRTILFPLYLFASSPWHFYLLTLLIYGCRSLEMPCFYTLVKQCGDSDSRLSSNNYFTALQNAIMVIGPIVGSLLQMAFGVGFVIWFNALTFLGSFALLSRIRTARSVELGWGRAGFFANIKTLMKRHPGTFILMATDAVVGIATGTLNSLMPIVAEIDYLNSSMAYSLMTSFLTTGMLLGNVLLRRLTLTRAPEMTYFIASIGGVLAFVIFGWTTVLPLCLIALSAVGVCTTFQDVTLATAIQNAETNDTNVTQLFSLNQTAGSAAVIFSSVAIGATINALGTKELVAIVGVTSIAGTIALQVLFRKAERRQND